MQTPFADNDREQRRRRLKKTGSFDAGCVDTRQSEHRRRLQKTAGKRDAMCIKQQGALTPFAENSREKRHNIDKKQQGAQRRHMHKNSK